MKEEQLMRSGDYGSGMDPLVTALTPCQIPPEYSKRAACSQYAYLGPGGYPSDNVWGKLVIPTDEAVPTPDGSFYQNKGVVPFWPQSGRRQS